MTTMKDGAEVVESELPKSESAPCSSHCSADLQVVRDWIHRTGECPTDTQLWFAFCSMLNEWKEQRRNGLDVLASVALDEMAETVEAMRDL